jgi:hypothetical protein
MMPTLDNEATQAHADIEVDMLLRGARAAALPWHYLIMGCDIHGPRPSSPSSGYRFEARMSRASKQGH